MDGVKVHLLAALLILLLGNPAFVFSQGTNPGPFSNTGKLTIDKSNLAVFTLSRNENSGNVPVSVSATTAFESDVVVTCVISQAASDIGYTKVTFTAGGTTITKPPVGTNTETGSVPFTVNRKGRPILVTCSASSTPADAKHIPQFTKSGSDLVYIQVKEPATVHFCVKTITVPHITGVTSGTFKLQFSDKIAVDNVTVSCSTCTTTCPNTPFVAGTSLAITIPNERAVVGDDSIEMTYKWTGPGSDVEIKCKGESDNSGKQYLATSSEGPSAIFAFDKGTVSLLPSLQIVRSTKFESLLVLDSLHPEELTFVCTLEQYNDTTALSDAAKNPKCEPLPVTRADASNTTVAATTTPATTATPTTAASTTASPSTSDNTTSTLWKLKESIYIFPGNVLYKTVEGERSAWPTTTVEELLLLSCCVPGGNSEKYINKTASAILFSVLAPNYNVNWTSANAKTASTGETTIKNPAFIDVAPCPCNLIKNGCDVNCCCDTDCTAENNKTFTCYPGIWGGNRTEGPVDRSCDSTRHDKEDWWMFTCVYYENNAYLGHYYNTQSGIRTKQSYATTLHPKRPTYSWKEVDKRNVAENVTGAGYKQGISIQTQIPATGGAVGVLPLPQRIVDGRCLRTAPVRYLMDEDTNCNFKMTKATCLEVGGPFNARSYVVPSTITHPPCPPYSGVKEQYGGTAYTTVNTNYFCTTDFNGYVKNLQDIPTVASRSLFSTTIDNHTTCEFNENGLFVCPNSTVATTPAPATPQRCAYDDSLKLPPEPKYDTANGICRNAVLDVQYSFYWAGKKIVNLTANYIIGNVPAEMSYTKTVKTYSTDPKNGSPLVKTAILNLKYPTTVTQKYSVRFTHDYKFDVLKAENPDVVDTRGNYSPKSGYPGYEIGKPIIAGIADFNTTTNTTDPVNYKQGNGIYYFKPDVSGLCTTAAKEPATFGTEVMSNCAIYLNIGDFDDCDLLRKTFLLNLDSMMPANYISQIGYVNDTNRPVDQHWAKIYRTDLTDVIFPVTNTSEAYINETIELQKLVTGLPNGTHDLVKPYEKIKGYCSYIPTGIRILILSAYTGNINGREIHRVVGAEIRYTLSNLTFSCTGLRGSACPKGSKEVQLFQATAAIDFADVPRNPSTDARSTTYGWKCYEEKCSAQLFYPFTRYYTQEPYQYTFGWFLIFIFLFLPTLWITHPWW